ncbi:MAG: RNA pseudouridine synthase, partial [Clostridia bacterium]
AYLFQNSKWDPNVENSFVPALCNRIDRNTGGLVIAAKNAPALRILNEKLREREIDKRYLCIVSGKLSPPIGELSSYLKKDNAENRVYAKSADTAGAKRAVTRYRTLKTSGELSLLECELITGRTHQIRAQLAACGHPLLGDEKYGDHALNKRYGLMSQALYSYKLTFAFKSPAAPLDYLNGRTFTVPHVPFANTYFGD